MFASDHWIRPHASCTSYLLHAMLILIKAPYLRKLSAIYDAEMEILVIFLARVAINGQNKLFSYKIMYSLQSVWRARSHSAEVVVAQSLQTFICSFPLENELLNISTE